MIFVWRTRDGIITFQLQKWCSMNFEWCSFLLIRENKEFVRPFISSLITWCRKLRSFINIETSQIRGRGNQIHSKTTSAQTHQHYSCYHRSEGIPHDRRNGSERGTDAKYSRNYNNMLSLFAIQFSLFGTSERKWYQCKNIYCYFVSDMKCLLFESSVVVRAQWLKYPLPVEQYAYWSKELFHYSMSELKWMNWACLFN